MILTYKIRHNRKQFRIRIVNTRITEEIISRIRETQILGS